MNLYMGKIIEVEVLHWRFPDYEIREVDGGEYVFGVYGADNFDTSAISVFSNSDLLLSVINLVPPDGGEITAQSLLEWCYEYGLPSQRSSLDYSTYSPPCTDINRLRITINNLYRCFCHWKSIVDSDTNDGDIKKNLADSVRRQFNVIPKYFPNSDTFGFRVETFDLITACYFQLACLLTFEGREGHLRECNNNECGRFFLAEHKNKRYCDRCNRKTVFSRKDRAIKRKIRGNIDN